MALDLSCSENPLPVCCLFQTIARFVNGTKDAGDRITVQVYCPANACCLSGDNPQVLLTTFKISVFSITSRSRGVGNDRRAVAYIGRIARSIEEILSKYQRDY
jgi:hypothetical protein